MVKGLVIRKPVLKLDSNTVMSAKKLVADVREVRDQVYSLGNEPGGLPAKVINGVQGKLMEKPGEMVVEDRDEYCRPGEIKPIKKLPIFKLKSVKIDKIDFRNM